MHVSVCACTWGLVCACVTVTRILAICIMAGTCRDKFLIGLCNIVARTSSSYRRTQFRKWRFLVSKHLVSKPRFMSTKTPHEASPSSRLKTSFANDAYLLLVWLYIACVIMPCSLRLVTPQMVRKCSCALRVWSFQHIRRAILGWPSRHARSVLQAWHQIVRFKADRRR